MRDLIEARLPALPEVPENPELEHALEGASFAQVKDVFLRRLMGELDRYLEEGTTVSFEKASEILRAIAVFAGEADGQVFAPIAEPSRSRIGTVAMSDAELVEGMVNGRLQWRGRMLPVINGRLITEVDGCRIKSCQAIENVGFSLNGIVELDDGRRLPVLEGKLVQSLGSFEIECCKSIKNIGGKLNGCVFDGGRYVPVMDGQIVLALDGKQILNFESFQNFRGKLNGRVVFSDNPNLCLPVVDGETIESVGTERIVDCRSMEVSDSGWHAEVMLERRGWQYFRVADGKLQLRGDEEIWLL